MFSSSGIKGLVFAAVMGLICIIAGCGGSGGGSSSSGTTIVVGSSGASLNITNSSLSLSGSTTVTATFKRADGSPAVGVPVTFTTTLGTLSAAGGGSGGASVTTNTDATGTATATLSSGSTSGQGQLTASATVDNRLLTTTGLFSVNLPALKLANLRFSNNSSATISYGGSQGITVDVQDAQGNPYTAQPVAVVFTSTQAAQGKATLSSPVNTVQGRAATTYTALTATGSDTITASIAGDAKTIALTINPLQAGALTFVSASPTNIGLKGMGGFGTQESSKVTFKVVDTSGAPKANQPVTFALNTNVGGLALINTTGSTGADGTVSTIVQSGVVATPVRVTASTQVAGTTLSTQSDQLVVSTGVPAQDGFSISESNLNPEAWETDGVQVKVTARLSDHFHNPVPDGTAVYFTTSGGSIQPSCTTAGGVCTVNWTSQNPRPTVATGARNAGRAVILAYAIGEEAFLDINGNGLADPGEFKDDPEAYRDDNENHVHDANETFIDFNADGVFNAGDGLYNGVLQGPAYVSAPKSKDVFLNTVLVMSSGNATLSVSDANGNSLSTLNGPGSFYVTVKDINGNTMPSGTTVTVKVPFGTLTGVTPYTVPQNTGFGVVLPYSLGASTSPTAQSGSIQITVTSPAGLVTTAFLKVVGNF